MMPLIRWLFKQIVPFSKTPSRLNFSAVLDKALGNLPPHQKIVLEGRAGVGGHILSHEELAHLLAKGKTVDESFIAKVADQERRLCDRLIVSGFFYDFIEMWSRVFQDGHPTRKEVLAAVNDFPEFDGVLEHHELARYILKNLSHLDLLQPVLTEEKKKDWIRSLKSEQPHLYQVLKEHDALTDIKYLEKEGTLGKDRIALGWYRLCHLSGGEPTPEKIFKVQDAWPVWINPLAVINLPFPPALQTLFRKHRMLTVEDFKNKPEPIESELEKPESEALRDFFANALVQWLKLGVVERKIDYKIDFFQAIAYAMEKLEPDEASVLSLRIGYPMGSPKSLGQTAQKLGLSIERTTYLEGAAVKSFFKHDFWTPFVFFWGDGQDRSRQAIQQMESMNPWLSGMLEEPALLCALIEKATGHRIHPIDNGQVFSKNRNPEKTFGSGKGLEP